MGGVDFVSVETAKLLGSKGFVFSWDFGQHFYLDGVFHNDPLIATASGELVPTARQSEVQKWLRDTHGKHVQITAEYFEDGINWLWQVLWPEEIVYDMGGVGSIDYNDGTGMYGDNAEYDTYEEALEAGILKALSLI
jgi:hypothetical protein